MDKRAIHLGNEPVKFQKYGNDGEAIYALSRGVLNNKMIDLAEQNGVEFFFNHKKSKYSLLLEDNDEHIPDNNFKKIYHNKLLEIKNKFLWGSYKPHLIYAIS